MKIRRAGYHPYDLPLTMPWATAKGSAPHRAGLLVWIQSNTGQVGWGDASPPPGSHEGTVSPLESEIAALVRDCNRNPPRLDQAAPLGPDVDVAVRHAWTQAVLSLQSAEAQLSLAHLLAQRLPHHPSPARRVPVNATIPLLPSEETVRLARTLVTRGYRCLKLKVGASPSDLSRVAAVRRAVGDDVVLRVDANGSWTEQDAPKFLSALAPHRLDYVEQPLPPGQPSALGLLRSQSPIPIAVDESAHHLTQAEALLERGACDVLIIKPAALGGLDRAAKLLALAHARRVRTVVTDNVDSAVGRVGALHLAALLGPSPSPCGLASSEWLVRDVAAAPPIQEGYVAVPSQPGLGVEPHAPWTVTP